MQVLTSQGTAQYQTTSVLQESYWVGLPQSQGLG